MFLWASNISSHFISKGWKGWKWEFNSRMKKATVVIKTWLLLQANGDTEVVEAGKHAIMRRTGLPARDLRILDPLLSYPSTVLGRERAIVINLEHIKAIITAHEVLLLNSRDPSVTPFVDELRARILRHHRHATTENDNPNREDGGGMKILPLEFVALEACLEAACSVLEDEAKTLEQEAHPALDKLTSKISTLNLERVRQMKSRLVAITGRVQKVRNELEHLLDDDQDMAEMYLTSKLLQQQQQQHMMESSSSDLNDLVQPAEISLEAEQHSGGDQVIDVASSSGKQVDVEELEMLLEAYFVQIDATFNKLSTLREYVDDTEDYINIMLDDKQNHLLQMGVMLTTATLVISAFVVVVGILGMNIRIELFKIGGMREFLWTLGGSTTGAIFLYMVVIAWCKHKRLLE